MSVYTYVAFSGTNVAEIISGYMNDNNELIIIDEGGSYFVKDIVQHTTILRMYFNKMKSDVIFVENNVGLEAAYIINALPDYKDKFYHSDQSRVGVRVTRNMMPDQKRIRNSYPLAERMLHFIDKITF